MPFPENAFRSEIKFYLPCGIVPKIREFIQPYIAKDPNAVYAQDMQYTVRSLYYDTDLLDFYYEKLDGLKIRKKLRIRTYNDFESDAIGFMEIKRRYDNLVLKERSKFPFEQIRKIMETPEKKWQDDKNNSKSQIALERFLYNLLSRDLKPTLLVCYEREAYVDALDPTVRLTIDFNLRSKPFATLDEMFQSSMFDHQTGDNCVLELKFNGLMPRWMRLLMTRHQLKAQSVSKYCMGVNSTMIAQNKERYYATSFC